MLHGSFGKYLFTEWYRSERWHISLYFMKKKSHSLISSQYDIKILKSFQVHVDGYKLYEILHFCLKAQIFILGNKYCQLFSLKWRLTLGIWQTFFLKMNNLNNPSLSFGFWNNSEVFEDLWKNGLFSLQINCTSAFS